MKTEIKPRKFRQTEASAARAQIRCAIYSLVAGRCSAIPAIPKLIDVQQTKRTLIGLLFFVRTQFNH